MGRPKKTAEEKKASKRAWYTKNRALSIERARQYRLTHPAWAKEMRTKHGSTWRLRHPEKAKALQKKQAFKRKLRKYNLTPDQFQEMHSKQSGKCAICLVVPSDGLVIDHNHKTNVVRELLCNRCNPAVGMIGENPDIARKIVDYLAKHNSANGIDSSSVSSTNS